MKCQIVANGFTCGIARRTWQVRFGGHLHVTDAIGETPRKRGVAQRAGLRSAS